MRILAKNLVLSQSQILINFYLNLIFRVFFVLFSFCSLLLSGSGFGRLAIKRNSGRESTFLLTGSSNNSPLKKAWKPPSPPPHHGALPVP